MIMQPQIGAMRGYKSPRVIHGMKAIAKGRGLNDPAMKRLPEKFQAMLKAAMQDATVKLKEKVNNLVWRMDRNGVIHITDTGIKVQ